MKIKSGLKFYFNGFSIVRDEERSKKEKVKASFCVASYFCVVPPILCGVVYLLSNLRPSKKKSETKVEAGSSEDSTIEKTEKQFVRTLRKEQVRTDSKESKRLASKLETLPVVGKKTKPGFFVKVINKGGYVRHDKDVTIPSAGMPIKFTPASESFEESLLALKKEHHIEDQNPIKLQFKDQTTEQAIHKSKASRIALNFANEYFAGGCPGFHKDPDTGLFVYDTTSTRAQEESLCQRSDLLASLLQLPHTLSHDLHNSKYIRNKYSGEFNSTKMAYISQNHLFALPYKRDFHRSHYLSRPEAVTFVTSAAKSYKREEEVIDCNKDSTAYQDARQRIETHLLAAASWASTSKAQQPDLPVELILGAFGCGDFAPRKNPDEYREMIATIYKELLPGFQGFFDVVTFALPTFGATSYSNAAVANHNIFKKVLKSEEEEPVMPKKPKKRSHKSKTLPVVSDTVKQGFFVDVLNKGGYSINDKQVLIPPAGMPAKYASSHKKFKKTLDALQTQYAINPQNKVKLRFKDQSTELAISESSAFTIALNFANEHHAGGGPGFHKDKDSGRFVYDSKSARAQEESLCQRSDLMASLTQLPHTHKADKSNPTFVRSYYDEEFDSKKMAYVSQNHLFAVQAQQNREFYPSRYLEEPKAVVFVTSAATCYGDKKIDCGKDSEAYQDAKQRIETHLLAAASCAGEAKRQQPDSPVELILGAFGCGAFVPKKNPDEYRKMIANIYKELLPEFQGFFDVVTFAVPTFGTTKPKDPLVANYRIFKEALKNK